MAKGKQRISGGEGAGGTGGTIRKKPKKDDLDMLNAELMQAFDAQKRKLAKAKKKAKMSKAKRKKSSFI